MIKFDDVKIRDNNSIMTSENITVDYYIKVIRFKDIDFSNISFIEDYILFNDKKLSYTLFDENTSNDNFDLYFENCIFSETATFGNIIGNTIRFDNCSFNNILLKGLWNDSTNENIVNGVILKDIRSLNNLTIEECKFYGKFYINKQDEKNNKKVEINRLIIKDTEFNDNFKLHHCEINEIEIKDTDFEKNADFYLSHFKSGIKQNDELTEIYFKALNFRCLALFGDTIFDQKFSLLYVTIEGYSHFRNAKFKEGLDLDYVNIQNEMNFYGIDIMNKDSISQETYRIIKHNFEKLGNKIEANKYHALELNQRRILLSNNKMDNIKEYIVFKLHNLSSEHSMNWFRALFWVFFVGIVTSFLNHSLLHFLSLPIIYLLSKKVGNILFTSIAMIVIYSFFIITLSSEVTIDDIFKYINIILKPEEFKSYFLMSLNKVSLGYLYYQFLMSVRKDTRK